MMANNRSLISLVGLEYLFSIVFIQTVLPNNSPINKSLIILVHLYTREFIFFQASCTLSRKKLSGNR